MLASIGQGTENCRPQTTLREAHRIPSPALYHGAVNDDAVVHFPVHDGVAAGEDGRKDSWHTVCS